MAALFAFIPLPPPTISIAGISQNSLYSVEKVDSEDLIQKIVGYELLRPIPIVYRVANDTDIEASFEEANIAMSGNSKHDAYQALIEEMLGAFEDWSADPSALGPGPLRQLQTLRKYIGGKAA